MAKEHMPRHIVAVDALVVNASDEILMIDSPKRGWEFPGGQVEAGETLHQALVREVREETGVEVSIGQLVGVYQNIRTDILMLGFLCNYLGGELKTSSESLGVEWVARSAVLERMHVPFIRQRMKDKLDFSGRVIYRAYRKERNDLIDTYEVVEESWI